MNASPMELLATGLFALAVAHTLGADWFQRQASKFPEGSVRENAFHLLGEVEVVFGLWAGILIVSMAILVGRETAIEYAEKLDFTDPLFVFAIMAIAATRPVIAFAQGALLSIGRMIPLPREAAIYLACLVAGPLLGSLITEPAAMTVTALILRDRFFAREVSNRFRHSTLAALFVNVSIGGVLTHFAAPPVLMVAQKWNWDTAYVFTHFGWKALIAVVINAGLATAFCFRELRVLNEAGAPRADATKSPWPMIVIHLAFLGLVVLTSHHPVIFLGVFLFFMGFTTITREYQDDLKLRESLLVAFFLSGLVVLGGLQKWWLAPVIQSLDALPLFLGAAGLTAFTDNAALTYLGSQVEGVSEVFRYALLGGAVAGGGLTVIANAPNPAGYSILQGTFGGKGVNGLELFAFALPLTGVAMACLWLF